MADTFDRRTFVSATSSAALLGSAYHLAHAADPSSAGNSAGEEIVVAVMGTNGRGSSLARSFAQARGVRIAYISDVDQRAMRKGIQAASSSGGKEPSGVKDFRHALDDKGVDVLVCAAPNHWHGPATILACSAGKHVYVEKPCSHNPQEGEWMMQAARKHDRVVTMGTQRRSAPVFAEAMDRIAAGEIGEVYFSKSWYRNRRPSIGQGKQVPVPDWLDYSLWQGPAPELPFQSNLLHYNWHWRWHWGNGELGNNGVHSIDISRWGLGVDYPIRVSAGGGRYRFDDDQQTPDTNVVTFDFPGGKSITWEGLSWSPLGFNKSMFGITFHGDKGSLVFEGSNYKIYDMRNKELASGGGSTGQSEHLANFLGCIRSGGRPNADIDEAHRSTLLCHLGNIAYRTGHTLHTDPDNGHIKDDPEAEKLWRREYREGWEPEV